MPRAMGQAVALAVAAVTVVAGCAVPGGSDPVVVTETVATVTGAPVQGGVAVPPDAAGSASGPLPSAPAPVPAGSDADLAAVAGSVAMPSGIALTSVGGGAPAQVAGDWQSGVAWSTIKVPLAVAVARTAPGTLESSASAITVSDNQAAEALWNSLGGGDAAASAVAAVLAEGGDSVSQVPSVITRDGYSIFGQTQWSLADQARFASALPCLASSGRVMDLMGQISPDQQWGLGQIPGAQFKGGWGPGEAGGYLVRQFGLVPGAGGDVAVALAVQAPTFEAGAAALTTMAGVLAAQLVSIPGGTC